MHEVWKDIKGFEGVYQVSSLGNLKSFKKDVKGRVLSNTNRKGGYFSVVLKNGNKIRCVRMHQLVAEAFIPNPNTLSQVHHKDGNKQNNCMDNLEWVSEREHHFITRQQNPSVIKGLVNYNRFVRPKKIQQYSLNGEFLAEYDNGTEAHLKTGVCARNIHQVASKTPFNKSGNVRKQAGGYIWKYKEEGVV